MSRRVVISGIGPLCAVGAGREYFWDAMKSGGRAAADSRIINGRKVNVISLRNFSAADYLESRKTYLDRTTEFLLAAVSLALEDADLDLKKEDPERVAAVTGSAYGCLSTMAAYFQDFAAKGPRFVKPILFPHAYANTPVSVLAIEYGIKGFHCHFSAGEAASATAISYAYDLVRDGRADVAIAAGSEALHDLVFAMHPDSVIGEGAAALVLEDLDRALGRGISPLAEVLGCGLSCCGADPGRGMEDATVRAMRRALKAGLQMPGIFLPSYAPHSGFGVSELSAARVLSGGVSWQTLVLADFLGNTFGASGALQATAAALFSADTGSTALVSSVSPGGSVASIAFGPLP